MQQPITSIDGAHSISDAGRYYTRGGTMVQTGQWAVGTNVPSRATADILRRVGLNLATGPVVAGIVGLSNVNRYAATIIADIDARKMSGVVRDEFKAIDLASSGDSLANLADPSYSYWVGSDRPNDDLDAMLGNAKVPPEDVKVLFWGEPTYKFFNGHMQEPIPGAPIEFAELLQQGPDDIRSALILFKQRLPNLALVIFSTRTYGGYGGVAVVPEGSRDAPTEQFSKCPAVIGDCECQYMNREAVLHQVECDPGWDIEELGVVLAHGPRLYANGIVPNDLGLSWCPYDFDTDGLHPVWPAYVKVSQAWRDFLFGTAWSMPWYRSPIAGPGDS